MRAACVWLGIMIALPLATGCGEDRRRLNRVAALDWRSGFVRNVMPSDRTRHGRPIMTAIALSAALNTSHRSMPNIMLEADEQANIIAYILSLK
jgi:hypothetical protein